MPNVHTADLDAFVDLVNQNGGDLDAARVVERYYPLDLQFDTQVDQDLDPFSTAYFEQQVQLYREIAARDLDQATGELHADDLGALATAPNPTGQSNAALVAEQVRATATMLVVACLGPKPKVLDMGAGPGLSSEVMAYPGGHVHAVDIDADFGMLARSRAAALGLDITRTELNFDDLDALEGGDYNAAFFTQSLHHCLKPWELIAKLRSKITSSGVIGFVGEPVQENWWRHWGIRLDHESVYVARQRGWFESGWSYRFIRECFVRNGMTLTFFSGGMRGEEIGIATADERQHAKVVEAARLIGLSERYPADDLPILDSHFRSMIGEEIKLLGRPGYHQSEVGRGTLIYGPYVTLEPGRYEIAFLATLHRSSAFSRSKMILDVAGEAGAIGVYRSRIRNISSSPTVIIRQFILSERAQRVEARLFISGGRWTASVPTLRRLTSS